MTTDTVPIGDPASSPDYSNYDMSYLLLEFRGRIGRAQFWWGAAILAVIQLAATIGVAALFGVDATTYFSGARPAVIVDMLVMVGLAFPSLALLTKRLNDRDMGPWLGILVFVLGFLVMTELYFKVPERLQELDFIALVPVAMMLGTCLWLLLECGLMPAFDDESHGTHDGE